MINHKVSHNNVIGQQTLMFALKKKKKTNNNSVLRKHFFNIKSFFSLRFFIGKVGDRIAYSQSMQIIHI